VSSLLEVNNISKNFGGLVAISDVSFSVDTSTPFHKFVPYYLKKESCLRLN